MFETQVKVGNGTKDTTDQFIETAQQVRRAVKELFKPAGIVITDHSGGLLGDLNG